MRRQFNWLVLAVTSLVVVTFVVPLALQIRRQAADRARVAAEQRAQSVAAALAVAVSAAGGDLDEAVAESALVTDASIHLPGGTVVGDDPNFPAVVTAAATGRATSQTSPDGDWAVGLPVATPGGVVAVVAVASATEMSAGVGRATALLGALAVVLVAGSVALADRLGRSIVRPVTELAEVAGRLADGDLTARAGTGGPPEVESVAAALNELAGRLGSIIDGEREALADLSHRLRTPLTALRLQAEQAGEHRDRLIEQVDRTQAAIDQLIREVRSRGTQPRAGAPADLAAVVTGRLAFWEVLARDQERAVTARLAAGPVVVDADPADLAALVDVLVGNVFAHTPVGTAFTVTLRRDGTTPVLEVADTGPGFPSGPDEAVRRGSSSGGSTGLGLDIARGLCERLGGRLDVDSAPGSGALVTAWLGPSSCG